MVKKWNDFKKLNESFRDDRSGMDLKTMMETPHTYKDGVACSLINIITSERGISEKNFSSWDIVSDEVNQFYENKRNEIEHIIDIFEANNWRKELLAEQLYNEYFNTVNINENKDFENISKPKGLRNKMKGVSLGKGKNGKFFVYTHRARCKYYDKPEDIPQKTIDFIESTG